MALKGVLLDVDGTLLLSVDAHAQSWTDAFAEAGYEVPAARARPLIGMGGDRVVPELVAGMTEDEEPGKTITSRRREIFLDRYAPGLQPSPGARDLLLRLRDDGLKLVVATSASEEELETLLDRAGVADLIEAATTSADAESSKPAPDIVQAALERSGLRAGDVVMLGDTPYDIESAGTAGVPVIALRCGGFDESGFRDAIAVYDDPADLLARYEESPLGRRGGPETTPSARS